MNRPERFFLRVFLFSVLLETASLLTYHVPELGPVFLGLMGGAALLLAIKGDLRSLAALVLLEGVIGGHGHLFSADLGGTRLTLRMVLFGVLVLAWLFRRSKTYASDLWQARHGGSVVGIDKALILIAMAVVWGAARGLAEGRGLGEIFSDANAYAFLLLIPIFLDLFRDKEDVRRLSQAFGAGLLWLSIKSLLLLYVFTHALDPGFLTDMYTWQRKFWLTEATHAGGGWFRIFSASDIFLVLGIFVGDLLLLRHPANMAVKAWKAIVVAAFLLCLSRSLWLGAFAGAAAMLPVLFRTWRPGFRATLRFVLRDAAVILGGVLLLLAVGLFPIPSSNVAGGGGSDVLKSRFSGDAAVSSRWKMLPPLEEGIARHPVMGSGFGAAITYQSDDPRIHDLYPGGVITTPAVEWQYLEIWYKMGLLGLAAVAFLFVAIGRALILAFKRAEGEDKGLALVLMIAFAAFIVANVFTPYINHPLGWLYIAVLLVGAHSITAPAKSA